MDVRYKGINYIRSRQSGPQAQVEEENNAITSIDVILKWVRSDQGSTVQAGRQNKRHA